MKKKLLAAIALFCAYLVGCSDNDSSSNSAGGEDLARYTVVVFGTAEGYSDSTIENVYEGVQSLMDEKDVRILFCYKYGKEVSYEDDLETGEKVEHSFVGKYAKPGQFVAFELTKNLDLNKIVENPVIVADSSQSLYEPGFLAKILNYASDSLPAQDYVLVFHGHGTGFYFDQDYPKDKRKNVALAKTQIVTTAGLLPDEWNGNEMNMYEVRREIEKSSIKHFKAIYFHNCYMGNMEILSEIYSYADYIVASEHRLASNGTLIVDFVKELYKGGDFEESMKSYLDNTRDHWKLEYETVGKNGDLNVIKTSEFETLFPIFQKIAKRMKDLYKDSKQKIYLSSTMLVAYSIDGDCLYDALDYVQKAAKITKDSILVAEADSLKNAFDKLFVKKIEVHYNEEQNIDSFSLSVAVADKNTLEGETDWGYKNKDAYEYTQFHKKTGWGEWLYTNDVNVLVAQDEAEE